MINPEEIKQEEKDDTVDEEEPLEKKPRRDENTELDPGSTTDVNFSLLNMLRGGMNPFLGPSHFLSSDLMGSFMSANPHALAAAAAVAAANSSPAKRARTRISDDQLKVLRQYFDINNSPSEQQIKEMSLKSGLAEKVIKHWFRNTLFKVIHPLLLLYLPHSINSVSCACRNGNEIKTRRTTSTTLPK